MITKSQLGIRVGLPRPDTKIVFKIPICIKAGILLTLPVLLVASFLVFFDGYNGFPTVPVSEWRIRSATICKAFWTCTCSWTGV